MSLIEEVAITDDPVEPTEEATEEVLVAPKKRGRPAGSRNKPKAAPVPKQAQQAPQASQAPPKPKRLPRAPPRASARVGRRRATAAAAGPPDSRERRTA